MPDELSVGEEIAYTAGAETYSPSQGGSFTVGPIAVSVRVQESMGEDGDAESAAEAYARARNVAAVMFETEFELKRQEFFKRSKELNK